MTLKEKKARNLKIKALYALHEFTAEEFAKKYNLSLRQVFRILKGGE